MLLTCLILNANLISKDFRSTKMKDVSYSAVIKHISRAFEVDPRQRKNKFLSQLMLSNYANPVSSLP